MVLLCNTAKHQRQSLWEVATQRCDVCCSLSLQHIALNRFAYFLFLLFCFVFSHVKCRRNVLDGRTMIEQLSELERRSDPVAIELAGVWTSSYAVVSVGVFCVAEIRVDEIGRGKETKPRGNEFLLLLFSPVKLRVRHPFLFLCNPCVFVCPFARSLWMEGSERNALSLRPSPTTESLCVLCLASVCCGGCWCCFVCMCLVNLSCFLCVVRWRGR